MISRVVARVRVRRLTHVVSVGLRRRLEPVRLGCRLEPVGLKSRVVSVSLLRDARVLVRKPALHGITARSYVRTRLRAFLKLTGVLFPAAGNPSVVRLLRRRGFVVRISPGGLVIFRSLTRECTGTCPRRRASRRTRLLRSPEKREESSLLSVGRRLGIAAVVVSPATASPTGADRAPTLNLRQTLAQKYSHYEYE